MDDIFDIVIIDNPNSDRESEKEEDIISLVEKETNENLLKDNVEEIALINDIKVSNRIKYSYRNKLWSKVNYINKSIKNVSKKTKLRDLEKFFGIVNNRLYIRK